MRRALGRAEICISAKSPPLKYWQFLFSDEFAEPGVVSDTGEILRIAHINFAAFHSEAYRHPTGVSGLG